MVQQEKSKDEDLFVTNFLLGGTAGCISKTLTAPIERVKLIMQTQDGNIHIKNGEIPRYSGIVNCFSRVYAEQGIKSFWAGNFTNCLRYFPTQAFNFAFKDGIKNLFPAYSSKENFVKFLLVNVASGGLAGASSLVIVYPLDYARTRLGSEVSKNRRDFKGLGDCLVKTVKGPKGFFGLYNGFGTSVVGIIPYRGTYFGLYDTLKSKNPYKDQYGFMGLLSRFGVAQFTAITAGYASYPFDTVRRRMQMQSEKPKEKWQYKSGLDCFKTIWKEEGFASFYKGAVAGAFRTVGSALVLVIYDQFKGLLAQ